MAKTAETVENDRELYARVGLSYLPHIIGLVDRNVLSPTYGCFDRSYWHYKTAAFPSGMYQEFVLPLALAFRHSMPGGELFHQQPRLRELAEAGIRYADRSSHGDGSCDDYFPYERALGAAAFALYACTESYLLLELQAADMVAFFRKRADWLLHREEAGKLSNHHALTALALHNVFAISGDARYREGARRRLEMLLGWQSEEGWFPEYEGCDPGYLTATIDFLAKYYQKSQDSLVVESLDRATTFAARFMHPDGSFGGTYGSRNTALFFPHGFEVLSPLFPAARSCCAKYLQGVRRGRRVHLDDDRMCAHLTYNHLQAYLDCWLESNGAPAEPSPQTRFWPGCRLYVHQDDSRYAVLSAAKGGVLQLFVNGELACADNGLIARMADGTTMVTHLIDDYRVTPLDDGIQIEGRFGVTRPRLPTVVKQAIFHLGMMVLGRWFSDWVRALLQKFLIVGKRTAPLAFRRTLRFGDRVQLVDEVWFETRGSARPSVSHLYAGSDHTSIYVAVSQSYQASCLHPWTDLSEHLEPLNRDGRVRIERIVG